MPIILVTLAKEKISVSVSVVKRQTDPPIADSHGRPQKKKEGVHKQADVGR